MKLELVLIVVITATTTLGTATAAGGDCDLSQREVSDCTWNIGETTTIDHDMTMTDVTSTCSVNGDSCAVLSSGKNLTIKSSTFTGSKTARFLEMQQGSHLSMTKVTASRFGSDSYDSYGGVLMANKWCTVELDKVEMTDNIAYFGGCLWMWDRSWRDGGGQLTATDSKFISNTAKIYAGAFYLAKARATITNCDFNKNAAYGKMGVGAGAIYCYGPETTQWTGDYTGDYTITGSRFTANTATGSGGAISVDGATVKITDCEFNENDSKYPDEGDVLPPVWWGCGRCYDVGDDIYCEGSGDVTISPNTTKYKGATDAYVSYYGYEVDSTCTGNIV